MGPGGRPIIRTHRPAAGGRPVRFAVSIGIADSEDRVIVAGAELLQQALGVADDALYQARRIGENRTRFAKQSDILALPA